MYEHGELFRAGKLSHAWDQRDSEQSEILKIKPEQPNVASLHRFAFQRHVGQVSDLNHEEHCGRIQSIKVRTKNMGETPSYAVSRKSRSSQPETKLYFAE